jgi:hypothetical protein
MVFCLATKKRIFHFTCSREGPNGWFVVRWLLQLPHIGVAEGRPNPRLHVFSRCVGIHWFISKTWPLNYKLQKEFKKIHLIFLRKICRGVLDVWNTKTIANLGSPSTQHTWQAPWWCGVDIDDRPVGNPKRRYDKHSNKSSLSCETKVKSNP